MAWLTDQKTGSFIEKVTPALLQVRNTTTGHQSSLVVSEIDSRLKGCRFESHLIQYTRWKWGQTIPATIFGSLYKRKENTGRQMGHTKKYWKELDYHYCQKIVTLRTELLLLGHILPLLLWSTFVKVAWALAKKLACTLKHFFVIKLQSLTRSLDWYMLIFKWCREVLGLKRTLD